MKETEILNLLLEKYGLEFYFLQFQGMSVKLTDELRSSVRNNKSIIESIADIMLCLRQMSVGLGISRVENTYMEKINAMSETVGSQGRTLLTFPER